VSPGQDRALRSARHAALGDPVRLAIVDELTASDRAPVELQHLVEVPSNLLAHHLDVLEEVGLISRSRSSGDGRRRYVHLHRDALAALTPGARSPAQRALFVCTRNSARSQLAAALWTRLTNHAADSAGTHPAERVHPGAISAGRRAGLDLTRTHPKQLDQLRRRPALVVTVCDRAHEELDPDPAWLHWSIPDPVPTATRAAFDATVAELRTRITGLVAGL
jgi:ArsR family transcriptional regulator, arsenate/arsenite/antimonite-responsive transcriptional repressor / arsenate reductase (thioredoxin)